MAAKIGAAAVSDDNGIFAPSPFAGSYHYAFFKRRLNGIGCEYRDCLLGACQRRNDELMDGSVIFLTPVRIS